MLLAKTCDGSGPALRSTDGLLKEWCFDKIIDSGFKDGGAAGAAKEAQAALSLRDFVIEDF